MNKDEERLLNVEDVSERLGVCKSKAYKIIKELNQIMATRGYRTIKGRVCEQILVETYFAKKGGKYNGR